MEPNIQNLLTQLRMEIQNAEKALSNARFSFFVLRNMLEEKEDIKIKEISDKEFDEFKKALENRYKYFEQIVK